MLKAALLRSMVEWSIARSEGNARDDASEIDSCFLLVGWKIGVLKSLPNQVISRCKTRRQVRPNYPAILRQQRKSTSWCP